MPFQNFFDPLTVGIELLFTVTAVIFCFLIYFRTRNIYELTKYEGIRYFRGAFLFFGLSYLLRFIFLLVLISRFEFGVVFPRLMFAAIFIFPLGYFSTVGILYLIFGLIWKKFGRKQLLFFGHGIALLLSLLSFIARSHLTLLLFQSFLLVLGIVLSITMHKSQKKLSQIRILYLLVLLLWLINLWIIGRPRPLSFLADIVSELVSIAVFIFIYYKISKWVR